MAKISYIDDDLKYVKAFIKRDYSEITNDIQNNINCLTFSFESDDKLYGYQITRNLLLSDSYEDDFYVVHFCFLNIETLHDQKQEKCMVRLLDNLINDMNEKKGYYNLKLPTNIVDLIRAYNLLKEPFIFCGGTVEQYIYGKMPLYKKSNDLNLFVADKEYVSQYYDELLTMTYNSFEAYQGQYHLSYAISDKAGDVYRNWIRRSLTPESTDKVIIAEYGDKPIGFVTVKEDNFTVVGVLSAVLEKYRQYGAYKAMIAYIINYAYGAEKCFITGTQFDNFIVQGAWNSLGMKPFYSFYNIHIDKR